MTATAESSVALPSGETISVLGQGTWHFAERPGRRASEITSLRLGIDLGMTVIDTAEMYADGAAEILVGEAIAGHRDDVFLVSKVLPHHASRRGTVLACQASLRRLGTDHLDLYLLHWRGPIPLEETLAGFADLVAAGLVRYWGVSNFDTPDMVELERLSRGRDVATNQILYNVSRRGPEYDLLPWCRAHGIPIMAYSPIEQGRILHHPAVVEVAHRHRATAAQVALAWVLRSEDVNAIPRTATPEHVRDNAVAADLQLTMADFIILDAAFPPPRHKVPLDVL
ncbi:MAG TPA: aldo/keto reductase [Pseudonocardiaceae bacterium]|jgi:diketogulonate reductase-like aldo/keto reductase|nr:aldo/keto reductase [Pseudonocardiaceae bacterium]